MYKSLELKTGLVKIQHLNQQSTRPLSVYRSLQQQIIRKVNKNQVSMSLMDCTCERCLLHVCHYMDVEILHYLTSKPAGKLDSGPVEGE